MDICSVLESCWPLADMDNMDNTELNVEVRRWRISPRVGRPPRLAADFNQIHATDGLGGP